METSNQSHFPEVLSFDGKKVRFSLFHGCEAVEKETTTMEFEQIIFASQYLAKRPLQVQKRYEIRIAPVADWNGQVLVTRFCKGDNGERLMRSSDNELRLKNHGLIREIIFSLRSIGFMWGDLCPRNIIIDSDVIWLVDFERKLILLDRPADKLEFSRHVRSYAWEEFSCFLFKEEIDNFFLDILTDETDPEGTVPVSEFSSRRKRALLEKLFGKKPATKGWKSWQCNP